MHVGFGQNSIAMVVNCCWKVSCRWLQLGVNA